MPTSNSFDGWVVGRCMGFTVKNSSLCSGGYCANVTVERARSDRATSKSIPSLIAANTGKQAQQQPQARPRIDWKPSRMMKGIMTNAAAESAHAMCQIAFTPMPAMAIHER